MQKIVGIGEFAISNNISNTIKTFALSTCIALTVYSPLRKVLGMVHIALPYSSVDKTGVLPGYYADTAVPLIIEQVCSDYGCCIGELVFHLYGGARSVKDRDIFKIGERNINAVKAILASYFVRINDEETGGVCSRTVEADVATGKAKVEYNSIII